MALTRQNEVEMVRNGSYTSNCLELQNKFYMKEWILRYQNEDIGRLGGRMQTEEWSHSLNIRRNIDKGGIIAVKSSVKAISSTGSNKFSSMKQSMWESSELMIILMLRNKV